MLFIFFLFFTERTKSAGGKEDSLESTPSAMGSTTQFLHLLRCNLLQNVLRSQGVVVSQVRHKNLSRFLDYSKLPKLNKEELEWQFVRGSGPGGQATNKTNNCVVLKHVPSGLVVKCHETRSQFENKKIAWKLMVRKLDVQLNGKDSIEQQEKEHLEEIETRKKRKQHRRNEMKKAFKEREGLMPETPS